MATYGYCRVSTVKQSDEGESLEVQERKIQGYATMQGLTVDRVFVERGVSGSKPLSERPEGTVLLSGLQEGDTIITAKLDRMFRSALDALHILGELKDRKVSLHMIDLGGDVTGNGISKLVFTILSAVAEAERDRIRERVKETKDDQKRRNRFLGGRLPFGWTVVRDDVDGPGGELVEVPGQQAAIRKMRKLHAEKKSLRGISEVMKADGFDLSHQGVAEVLRADSLRSMRRERKSRTVNKS
jgi:putative DNA-invertase from lambdoid prophage Rac